MITEVGNITDAMICGIIKTVQPMNRVKIKTAEYGYYPF